MAPNGCKNDALVDRLAFVLEADYGIPRSEIDAGYMATALKDGEFTMIRKGAGDGCLSYREVIAKAAEVATYDSFSVCGQNRRIAEILSEDFGIKLPWLFYDESEPPHIDHQRTLEAAFVAGETRERVFGAAADPCDALPPMERLARTIFDEIVPFAQFRSGEIDPLQGVWRLHSAMLAAGLESSFVLIQNDPLGEHLHQHVALSVKVDDGRSVIVDPAYETFDLVGMNDVPLDTTQALSYFYYHKAMSTTEDPVSHLEMAYSLDRSNLQIFVSRTIASADVVDPLRFERSFYWNSFDRAREILRGEAKKPQSESEASLDLVIRSMK